MTVDEQKQAVLDFLRKNGTTKQAEIVAAFSIGSGRSAIRDRLDALHEKGLVRNLAPRGGKGIWEAVPVVEPVGEITPPNRRNVMTAPVLVPDEMQPARRGAADHINQPSKRGDQRVSYQPPIHMCSALAGGMK